MSNSSMEEHWTGIGENGLMVQHLLGMASPQAPPTPISKLSDMTPKLCVQNDPTRCYLHSGSLSNMTRVQVDPVLPYCIPSVRLPFSLRQCLCLPSTKTSRDTASIAFESPGRLPGAWLREAGRGWKVSDKFLRERLTVNLDLWVASSPSNDIIELEDPHVLFPDSVLTTFAADHSRGMTPYGVIISQGETGPQKRREPRYAL
ncbi:hypothetical protein OUZ56_027742 [Daphnia magna]|uniref:Uncharacterized protein n=1 Tax=Daphnia magna TaxID=35525 RepID=A0ABR0B1S8_9CRUS|nr:hypothetical protein OUZ56_027742 [Daphnia magna]